MKIVLIAIILMITIIVAVIITTTITTIMIMVIRVATLEVGIQRNPGPPNASFHSTAAAACLKCFEGPLVSWE